MAAINVAPAITNHPTLRKFNSQLTCSPEQHSRFWLAAITVGLVLAGMKANLYLVQWDGFPHFLVHSLDNLTWNGASSHVGLVRGYNEQKTGLLETPTCLLYAGKNLELVEVAGRIWQTIAGHSAIDDAVAIQKNCPAHIHFVLSHFVLPTLSLGCETNRCHTTA